MFKTSSRVYRDNYIARRCCSRIDIWPCDSMSASRAPSYVDDVLTLLNLRCTRDIVRIYAECDDTKKLNQVYDLSNLLTIERNIVGIKHYF